jgi:UDP-glucose 4-epimerase
VLLHRTLEELNPDVIVNLAALHCIPFCETHETGTITTNVGGTNNLLAFLKHHQSVSFVFASSAAVYESKARPLSETDSTMPITVYGKTKLAAEQSISRFTHTANNRTVVLRIFNAYGPGDSSCHVIPKILLHLRTARAPILGRVGSIRDFVYVTDIAEVFDRVACNEAITGTFNVGTGRGHRIAEVGHLLADLLGTSFTFSTLRAQMRAADPPCLIADVSKAFRDLGWSARVDLRTGLRALIETKPNRP